MTKQKLTLAINQDLLNKARDCDINFSSFLEVKLQEYLAIINGAGIVREERGVGSLRFELKTSSVSGRRHNQLDHEP
jgi:predicted DNA-binding ribbon-helix-helix protein